MKIIKKNQRKVGTATKKKQKRNRKLNKRLMKLEIALEKIKKILQTKSEIYRPEPLKKPTWICLKEEDYTELEILIMQALKG